MDRPEHEEDILRRLRELKAERYAVRDAQAESVLLDAIRLICRMKIELRIVADAVEDWPEHPWIPGTGFDLTTGRGRELRRIVTRRRSA